MANCDAKGEGQTKKARKNGTNKAEAISMAEIFDEDDN